MAQFSNEKASVPDGKERAAAAWQLQADLEIKQLFSNIGLPAALGSLYPLH
jgi:hypothetical protein